MKFFNKVFGKSKEASAYNYKLKKDVVLTDSEKKLLKNFKKSMYAILKDPFNNNKRVKCAKILDEYYDKGFCDEKKYNEAKRMLGV